MIAYTAYCYCPWLSLRSERQVPIAEDTITSDTEVPELELT